MKRLKEIKPYGYSCVVQKVECRNHLLRNYSQKIMALTNKTEYPIRIWNYIANNAMRFRTAITKSIAHHKDVDGTMSDKINGLLYSCTFTIKFIIFLLYFYKYCRYSKRY